VQSTRPEPDRGDTGDDGAGGGFGRAHPGAIQRKTLELPFFVFKNNQRLLVHQRAPPEKEAMRGFGKRLRDRARELGLTDADVAGRVGLTQQRYHAYVADRAEPDLETLVRICTGLGTTPDAVLGVGSPQPEDEPGLLRARVLAALETMAVPTMRAAAAVVDALAREHEPNAGGQTTRATRRLKRKPG
jgi:transcriptional regulator with XRE-family HTH domain